ncbi:aldehyde dehydrogenase family protein [Umezawaea tangerina]|uniref:Aldehyde dehydrogenase n=1 Tax=Umezawaea tangerina TaxID=84725 RepID=A0A2T0SSE5_9PSEU|nr:aldehyde dehydrogenase family protein [Umezawaea tangerina]PRY36341.1 aldehyde dehydrogenase [Umezawaea tangerina]
MAKYAAPGRPGGAVSFRDRYDHFVGGEYVPPTRGNYFTNPSPVTGEVFTAVARGTAEDVDRALDAAHGAARAWGRTTAAERAAVLTEVADRIEDSLEAIAVAEAWDAGRPIRETLSVDLPAAADHFRYCAGVVRAQEGGISQLDGDLVAHHFHEPLGVVGLVVPWSSPVLTAAWHLAPALAAGNTVVLKPSEYTPASIHVLVGLISDLLPPGVLNVVTGFDVEAAAPLAANRRVTRTARPPAPRGWTPGVYFADLAERQDACYDRALDAFARSALTQASSALVQNAGYDRFLLDATARTAAARLGDPLDPATTVGPLVSAVHLADVLSRVDLCAREGARLVAGGDRVDLGGALTGGYFVAPTVFETDHPAGVPHEDFAGPVTLVTRFDDFDDAVKAANDAPRGAAAGVWSRDAGVAYRAGRAIRAGRVWVNNQPPHAAFHAESRGLVEAYQHTKNLVVAY